MHVAGGFCNAGGVGKGAKVSLPGKSFAGGGKPVFSVLSWCCLEGKRRAKLLPLKCRRKAKSESWRDEPASDKGAPRRGGSEERARRLLAGLPWIFVLIGPFLAWKQREKRGR